MRRLLGFLLLLVCVGCVRMPTEPPTFLSPGVFPQQIRNLPEPPPSLSSEEQTQTWATEYQLGKAFAARFDLYRAITCFQRARFLLQMQQPSSFRCAQMVHASLLSYCLGGKYQEAIDLWEQECDSYNGKDPKLNQDVICLLFDAYCHVGRQEDGYRLLSSLPQEDPLQQRLPLFFALASNDEQQLLSSQQQAKTLGDKVDHEAAVLIDSYRNLRKDPCTACLLNGVLPGAGYLYIGQTQTAITSLALNTAFIVAAVQLFAAHQPAAAIIATGFEVGWYGGGVMGAGLAAKAHNQRLREQLSRDFLSNHQLFPLQMVQYKW